MNITAADLLRLIAKGQNSHVEFHHELGSDDAIARALCAFANTRGGWLIVGADPEGGELRGSRDVKSDLSRIRLVVEEDLKPALNVAVNSVRTDAGHLIAVHVNTSDDRPHSVPGPSRGKREILVRVGTANHTAEGATLNALRSHRTQGQPSDALEAKIMAWLALREEEALGELPDASPAEFGQQANVGLRRASKAFINLERAGLVIGRGERSHRWYALP